MLNLCFLRHNRAICLCIFIIVIAYGLVGFMSKHEQLAFRLSQILHRLNAGERLDAQQLAEEFAVKVRTIQRDLNERLGFLAWSERGGRYYRLDKTKLGHLHLQDIERFARFCGIRDLLPEIDRRFYQECLTQSVMIKGFQYEDIKNKQTEFNLIHKSIDECCLIEFHYHKAGKNEGKYYTLEPYVLLNRNGVWYVIGIDREAGRQKTFCFTQMSCIRSLNETFEPNSDLRQVIKNSDSIFHGNQLAEVIIKTSSMVAPYFLRRNLLPNQELIRKLEDGGLLLGVKNVNEMEIVPIVQYWLPHVQIVSPIELQHKMEQCLQDYLREH